MMFGWLDISVLALCLIAVVGVGVWSGRDERTTRDYFLGGKRQHWFVVGLSIIATEVSALTFIGVPADSFRGDWNYLQMYFGSFLGRMLVVALLLPAFYRNNVTTVYEYLGRRFGPRTRLMASIMFFASRILGSGIRLLVASLAISVVFGWRLELVIVGAASVVVAYTMFGGIKAIIWTDAVQAVIFIGGGIAAVVCLFFLTPGDAASNLAFAYQENKFHMFTWTADLNNEKSFFVLFVSATFVNMAALGTDQDLTQRMLTCPDLKRGQRSLLFNAFAGIPIVMLFLLVGTLLFSFYEQTAAQLPAEILAHDDRIFPYFIANSIPVGYGLKGLLVAGIFAAAMSSLDSALGALSSTAVNDVYRIYIRPNGSERHYVFAARIFVLAFGVALVAVAIAFAEHEKLLWATFKWVGLIFGSLLGVFLLGVLTKGRGADGFTVVAMLSAVLFLVAVNVYQEYKGQVWIAWPWWIVIGTIWTFALGACTTSKSHDTAATNP